MSNLPPSKPDYQDRGGGLPWWFLLAPASFVFVLLAAVLL